MAEKAGNLNVRLLVLLLWILLAFLYSSLAYDYIVASNKDKTLDDYLQYIVVLSVDEHRPVKEVRTLVLSKADELKIDLRGDQVGISGFGTTLKITVNYEVDINLPVVHRAIYHKVFEHSATYRNIR